MHHRCIKTLHDLYIFLTYKKEKQEVILPGVDNNHDSAYEGTTAGVENYFKKKED